MACEITAATKNTKQIQRRRWDSVNVDSSAAPPPGTSEWCISTAYNVRFGSAPDNNLPMMSSGSSHRLEIPHHLETPQRLEIPPWYHLGIPRLEIPP